MQLNLHITHFTSLKVVWWLDKGTDYSQYLRLTVNSEENKKDRCCKHLFDGLWGSDPRTSRCDAIEAQWVMPEARQSSTTNSRKFDNNNANNMEVTSKYTVYYWDNGEL